MLTPKDFCFVLNYMLRVGAAYLGALHVTETSCVTQPCNQKTVQTPIRPRSVFYIAAIVIVNKN